MKKQKDLFETLFETFTDPYTKMFQLDAIWLEKPIRTSLETKRRITGNDLVLIENGKLIDCNDAPSHKIKLLHGTLSNTRFTITVENLSTNELSIINV